MNKSNHRRRQRSLLVIAIMIPIALLHFVTGSQYSGPFPLFVNGYLIDILLPFGFYFLLSLTDHPYLNSWKAKALLIFAATTAVELAQYRGIPLLGRTFDPLDILMYALGILLAVACDQLLFPKIFSFWKKEPDPDQKHESSANILFNWRKN